MRTERRRASAACRLRVLPVGRLDNVRLPVGPPPDLRLFCFPYAGGGPAPYRQWPAQVPEGCEVWSFQYPGQGPRFDEPPYTDWRRLVADLSHLVTRFGGRRFAFFGHSMGGLVAFECARALRRSGGPLPVHLVVSGCRAPGPELGAGLRRISELPRDRFVEEIRAMGGTPREVLESPEILDLLVPQLRSDFALIEQYTFRKEVPLEVPLSVWIGSDDRLAPVHRCLGWKQETRGEFALDVVEGGHFFLHHDVGFAKRVVDRVLSLSRSSPQEAASIG